MGKSLIYGIAIFLKYAVKAFHRVQDEYFGSTIGYFLIE